MHIASIILKVLMALVAVAMVAHLVYTERRNLKFIRTVWSRFRVIMFFEVFGMLLVTISVYLLLMWCSPIFKYGWTHLFLERGGNLFIAPMTDAITSDIGWLRIVPFFFFLLFLVAIPFMARIEEQIFRQAHFEWRDIIKMSVIFGLVHCIVGVPLGAGIALIGTGLFYACKYRKTLLKEMKDHHDVIRANEEALLVSTTYHAFYNTVVIIIVMVVLTIAVLN